MRSALSRKRALYRKAGQTSGEATRPTANRRKAAIAARDGGRSHERNSFPLQRMPKGNIRSYDLRATANGLGFAKREFGPRQATFALLEAAKPVSRR